MIGTAKATFIGMANTGKLICNDEDETTLLLIPIVDAVEALVLSIGTDFWNAKVVLEDRQHKKRTNTLRDIMKVLFFFLGNLSSNIL